VPAYLPPPDAGRRFTGRRRVRLADTDPQGRLRPDAVARYLQDVATDDWDDTGIDTGDLWVVRRTAQRLARGGGWPTLGTEVTITTWCSGIGAAWAERRTDLAVAGVVQVQTEALWVPLDASGRPRRIRGGFRDAYEEAAAGRKVPGRVEPAVVAQGTDRRPWPLRRVDLDVAGHVNNAASWAPLVEVLSGAPMAEAVLTHHLPVEWGEPVELASAPGRMWLLNADTVLVSATYELS
jgi:acyl-ACP thioesterase